MEEDDEDIELYKQRMKEEDQERVKFEIPIDLSTAFVDFDYVTSSITPATSVLKRRMDKRKNIFEFSQDFHVLIQEKNKQTFKIFEYRVYYTPVEGYEFDPEDPDKLPYDCRATLIGYKLMYVEPHESLEKT